MSTEENVVVQFDTICTSFIFFELHFDANQSELCRRDDPLLRHQKISLRLQRFFTNVQVKFPEECNTVGTTNKGQLAVRKNMNEISYYGPQSKISTLVLTGRRCFRAYNLSLEKVFKDVPNTEFKIV